MGRDESGTLARLREHRTERLEPTVARHGGRLVKLTGDGALIEFPSAVDALSAVIEFQQAMGEANRDRPEDTRIMFRIGLHLGDLIVDGDDLYGDGVNVAARLEAKAPAGGIVISGNVHDAVSGRLKATFDDLGRLVLKNIERPVQAFGVKWEPSDWKLIAQTPVAETPHHANAPLALPDKPSIAVLPFQNMGGDPEQEYFADGMVEEIITALSRYKWLFVIARNSSFAYKGKSPDIRQVGRELGVHYVLEGSVRRAGNRIRLTGQLIDAATGAHLWADRYDGTMEDIFDLQDRLTGSVVAAIEPKLRLAEIERTRRKPAASLQAYDLLLQGMALARSLTGPGLDKADGLVRRAVELDPGYALGFAHLAQYAWVQIAQGWRDPSDPTAVDMIENARRALALDSDDPEILTIVAPVIALPAGEFSEGLSLIDKAIDGNPNSAYALRVAGLLRGYAGEIVTALEHLKRADRLNPLAFAALHHVAHAVAYFAAGDHAAVVEWTGRTLRVQPNHVPSLRYRAASLGLLDRRDEGRLAVCRILEHAPATTIAWVRHHVEFAMNHAFKTPGVAESLYEGLRRSGMPEE